MAFWFGVWISPTTTYSKAFRASFHPVILRSFTEPSSPQFFGILSWLPSDIASWFRPIFQIKLNILFIIGISAVIKLCLFCIARCYKDTTEITMLPILKWLPRVMRLHMRNLKKQQKMFALKGTWRESLPLSLYQLLHLYLCYSILQPPATCACWALEMWTALSKICSVCRINSRFWRLSMNKR